MAPRRKPKPGAGQEQLPFGPTKAEQFQQTYGSVGYSSAGLGRPQAGPGFISPSESDPPTTPGAAGPAATGAVPGFNMGTGPATGPSTGPMGTGPLPNLRMGSSTPFRGAPLRSPAGGSATPAGGPYKNDAFVGSLNNLPNNGNPAAPSVPYNSSNPAPPVSANPMPPGYSQAPSYASQVGRMAQGAVNQYQMSKVPGTPQAAVAEGAVDFAKWSVRPATHNLDTMMQRNWSSESKNLVYGRGVSEPSAPGSGPFGIQTDNMALPSYSRPKAQAGDPRQRQLAAQQQQHSNPHPVTGHGMHIHDDTAFLPQRGPGGEPPMLQGAGTPPRPIGPAGGAARDQDLLFAANRAGPGGNAFWNPHDMVVSGLNVKPVQSIGAQPK